MKVWEGDLSECLRACLAYMKDWIQSLAPGGRKVCVCVAFLYRKQYSVVIFCQLLGLKLPNEITFLSYHIVLISPRNA